MNQPMRRCPHCGAYVMSDDNLCPRCDQPLDQVDHAPDQEPDEGFVTEILPPDTGIVRTSPETAVEEPVVVEALERDQLPTTALPEEVVTDDAPPILAEPPVDENEFAPAITLPRLQDALAESAPDESRDQAGEDDTSEMPTAPNVIDQRDAIPADQATFYRQPSRPIIPPAPYTPPPTPAPPIPTYIAPPPPVYGYGYRPPAIDYVQQRVLAYRRGGYRLHLHTPTDATLSYGKPLGAVGWLLALISIIGVFWYMLLLALNGFQRDVVDIVLESDGQLYEDGPGAAHVRRQRARTGRRWRNFGVLIGLISLVLGIGLGVVAGIVLSSERYQAALREAYPAVTLFEEHFSATEARPDDVSLAKDGAVAYAVLGGIAAVGLWGGATLWVIGTIHARAYRVSVSALPGWG